jgi:hypothetical protein
MEGAFVAIGLGLLFYSIYIHNSRSRSTYLENLDQPTDAE